MANETELRMENDTNKGTTDTDSFRLNPALAERLNGEVRAAIDGVECRWVIREESPWYKRLAEGVLHHLAGELAGVLIGATIGLFAVQHGVAVSQGTAAAAGDNKPPGISEIVTLCIYSQFIEAPRVEDATTSQVRWLTMGPCPLGDKAIPATEKEHGPE